MEIAVLVPKALSVRDENEFYVHQHVMARLNPKLRVTQIGTGVHVDGGPTVFWGIVHAEGQKVSLEEVHAALQEAGFDFKHNGQLPNTALAALNRTAR